MFIIEILVLIVFLAFIINGYRAGSIETLGRVIGAVAGFIFARAYAVKLVGVLSVFIKPDWAYLAAFLAIFLIIDTLIGWLFRTAESLLKIFTRLPILNQINSVLGGIFGFLEGIVVIGGVNFLLAQSMEQAGIESLANLKTVSVINFVFEKLFGIFL
jgi:uncharacterized membrane protein required for colicin V production